MAKRTFKHFVPRPKPRKRPGRHKKSLNKMKNVVIKNITDKADELAKLYNKTKDPKYKEEWYKLIKSLPALELAFTNPGYIRFVYLFWSQ